MRGRRFQSVFEGAKGFRPSRELLVIAGSLALVAFALGYALTALAFQAGGAPTDVVLVPDLREMTVTEAARTLADNELTLAVGDSFPNATVDSGAVLAQTPLPGQEVSPGTEVTIMVSTGQMRPLVPDVQSMTLSMATMVLQTAGFSILVEEAPGEGEPGEVISVDPPAGTPLAVPDTVILRVGAASPFLVMPEVTGMPEDAARAVLEGLGLPVSEVFYESVENGSAYQVIGQTPAAGDSISAGEAVRLRVTVPAVIRGDALRRDRPSGSPTRRS